MLTNTGSKYLYRGIAHYEGDAQRNSMIDWVKALEGKACAFDNTVEPNILIVDFDRSEDRENFSREFKHGGKLALAA